MSVQNTINSVNKLVRGLIKDLLQYDGKNLFEYDSDNTFNLSEPFIAESSIVVYKNGTVLDANDYSYNSDTNQVTIDFITSGQSLVAQDIILITYNYYKKYSDTEIRGYIESSLMYFAIYKYKKIFEIADDVSSGSSEILTVNGVYPTTEELYFIAGIASILIDPQNITVDVDGNFKLSAVRKLSDQEQILSAFAHFKRFVGSVEYELIETDYNYDR